MKLYAPAGHRAAERSQLPLFHQFRERHVFKLLLREQRRIVGIEILYILRDVGKTHGTEGGQEQGINVVIIHYL